VPFSPADVWRVLRDVAAYPDWWPGRLRLKVLRAEREFVGSEVELRPFGGQPFRCRIDAADEPRAITTRYFGGFITGRGVWRLEPSDSGTRVRYELDVVAEGVVVAALARIVDLGRLHSRLMRDVFAGLQGALDSRHVQARATPG